MSDPTVPTGPSDFESKLSSEGLQAFPQRGQELEPHAVFSLLPDFNS
jgi:hypothetical protein